jgi:hypothetical protein
MRHARQNHLIALLCPVVLNAGGRIVVENGRERNLCRRERMTLTFSRGFVIECAYYPGGT